MEVVHGAPKAAKSVSQDFISSMPDNVITNIMNRLPIKDALKTGILSKNWSYQYWNMVTEVVLDSKFCRYLYEGDEDYNGWILNRLLINLKGPITKFVLDIHLNKLPVEEISQWVLFLSRKGIKDLTLIMHGGRPLTLPRHLYSCMELKHLELYNCCFSPLPWFPGFPNLLSLDLSRVKFQSFTVAEFIARCPLLEILKIRDCGRTTSEEIFIEVAKHGNLKSLLTEGNKTRWNKLVPIKINILAWRLINDRLPTRLNLDSRGIDLHSLLCPVCDDTIESAQHLFLHCNLASNLWNSVFKWWKVDNMPNTLMDLITWVDSANLPGTAKDILDGVILTTVWVIWRYRNKICFDEKPPRKDTLMDDIKTSSFSWIVNRSKTFRPLWLDWLNDPMSTCNSCL